MNNGKNLILNFLFLETALELVPKEIRTHSSVKKDAKRRRKKPSKIILDDSKHHTAMRILDKKEKRGRPDIIHQCLLSLLDNPFRDYFRVYIHTFDNKIIWINSQTRLPRNYNRFIGLMEDLFEKKVIKTDNLKLLEILDADLDTLLKNIDPPVVILMREKGKKDSLEKYLEANAVIAIGAFPHGDFEDKTLNILGRYNLVEISFGEKPCTSLYITNKVAIICENFITKSKPL